MGALQKIREAGFDVLLDGDTFEISPASVLSQQQRAFLKSHRAEIIDELQAEVLIRDRFDDRRFCRECQHLMKSRCTVQDFRPVDDMPRRCHDFISANPNPTTHRRDDEGEKSMFIPCKIKAIDASDKSTMVTFDLGGRSIAFTYSNHHAESQLVVAKLHKFGSRNSHHALKSWSELIGVEGEVNLIEVKTAFGNMPAITDFR